MAMDIMRSRNKAAASARNAGMSMRNSTAAFQLNLPQPLLATGFEPGRLSTTRFNVIKILGQGSFGTAYLVEDKVDPSQKLVIKKINISSMDSKGRRAALGEVEVLARLQHPNICAYYGSWVEGDPPHLHILLEYCDGGDMAVAIKEAAKSHKFFPEDVIMTWFVQLSSAILYCHQRRILHRDLKASNIFLSGTGVSNRVVKLADFGIARVLHSEAAMAATVIGTPYYMSPELCQNAPYNHKSDIWSLGCCLYEMCTLQHAFAGKNVAGLILSILRGSYPPIPPKYSKGCRDLIDSMLQLDPTMRPSMADILANPMVQDVLQRALTREDDVGRAHFERAHNTLQTAADAERRAAAAEAEAAAAEVDLDDVEHTSVVEDGDDGHQQQHQQHGSRRDEHDDQHVDGGGAGGTTDSDPGLAYAADILKQQQQQKQQQRSYRVNAASAASNNNGNRPSRVGASKSLAERRGQALPPSIHGDRRQVVSGAEGVVVEEGGDDIGAHIDDNGHDGDVDEELQHYDGEDGGGYAAEDDYADVRADEDDDGGGYSHHHHHSYDDDQQRADDEAYVNQYFHGDDEAQQQQPQPAESASSGLVVEPGTPSSPPATAAVRTNRRASAAGAAPPPVPPVQSLAIPGALKRFAPAGAAAAADVSLGSAAATRGGPPSTRRSSVGSVTSGRGVNVHNSGALGSPGVKSPVGGYPSWSPNRPASGTAASSRSPVAGAPPPIPPRSPMVRAAAAAAAATPSSASSSQRSPAPASASAVNISISSVHSAGSGSGSPVGSPGFSAGAAGSARVQQQQRQRRRVAAPTIPSASSAAHGALDLSIAGSAAPSFDAKQGATMRAVTNKQASTNRKAAVAVSKAAPAASSAGATSVTSARPPQPQAVQPPRIPGKPSLPAAASPTTTSSASSSSMLDDGFTPRGYTGLTNATGADAYSIGSATLGIGTAAAEKLLSRLAAGSPVTIDGSAGAQAVVLARAAVQQGIVEQHEHDEDEDYHAGNGKLAAQAKLHRAMSGMEALNDDGDGADAENAAGDTPAGDAAGAEPKPAKASLISTLFGRTATKAKPDTGAGAGSKSAAPTTTSSSSSPAATAAAAPPAVPQPVVKALDPVTNLAPAQSLHAAVAATSPAKPSPRYNAAPVAARPKPGILEQPQRNPPGLLRAVAGSGASGGGRVKPPAAGGAGAKMRGPGPIVTRSMNTGGGHGGGIVKAGLPTRNGSKRIIAVESESDEDNDGATASMGAGAAAGSRAAASGASGWYASRRASRVGGAGAASAVLKQASVRGLIAAASAANNGPASGAGGSNHGIGGGAAAAGADLLSDVRNLQAAMMDMELQQQQQQQQQQQRHRNDGVGAQFASMYEGVNDDEADAENEAGGADVLGSALVSDQSSAAMGGAASMSASSAAADAAVAAHRRDNDATPVGEVDADSDGYGSGTSGGGRMRAAQDFRPLMFDSRTAAAAAAAHSSPLLKPKQAGLPPSVPAVQHQPSAANLTTPGFHGPSGAATDSTSGVVETAAPGSTSASSSSSAAPVIQPRTGPPPTAYMAAPVPLDAHLAPVAGGAASTAAAAAASPPTAAPSATATFGSAVTAGAPGRQQLPRYVAVTAVIEPSAAAAPAAPGAAEAVSPPAVGEQRQPQAEAQSKSPLLNSMQRALQLPESTSFHPLPDVVPPPQHFTTTSSSIVSDGTAGGSLTVASHPVLRNRAGGQRRASGGDAGADTSIDAGSGQGSDDVATDPARQQGQASASPPAAPTPAQRASPSVGASSRIMELANAHNAIHAASPASRSHMSPAGAGPGSVRNASASMRPGGAAAASQYDEHKRESWGRAQRDLAAAATHLEIARNIRDMIEMGKNGDVGMMLPGLGDGEGVDTSVTSDDAVGAGGRVRTDSSGSNLILGSDDIVSPASSSSASSSAAGEGGGASGAGSDHGGFSPTNAVPSAKDDPKPKKNGFFSNIFGGRGSKPSPDRGLPKQKSASKLSKSRSSATVTSRRHSTGSSPLLIVKPGANVGAGMERVSEETEDDEEEEQADGADDNTDDEDGDDEHEDSSDRALSRKDSRVSGINSSSNLIDPNLVAKQRIDGIKAQVIGQLGEAKYRDACLVLNAIKIADHAAAVANTGPADHEAEEDPLAELVRQVGPGPVARLQLILAFEEESRLHSSAVAGH